MDTNYNSDETCAEFVKDVHKWREAYGWHRHLQSRFMLHPIIDAAMCKAPPASVDKLVMEWPHVSLEVPTMLAYTRDVAAGEANRQTRVAIGKYVKRHFPSLPDHVIRDLVALHVATVKDTFEIWRDAKDIVSAAIEGPRSCMSGEFSISCKDDEGNCVYRHPYEVYDPALGWGVAVRLNAGEIVGRALVYEGTRWGSDEEMKIFVRTYRRTEDYSPADEALHAWLVEKGYKHAGSWEGCPIRLHETTYGDYLAPYLDGCVDHVTPLPNERVMVIDEDGTHDAGDTDGICRELRNTVTCEHCDDEVDEDETCYVGVDADYLVCHYCVNEHFTSARSRHGYMRYIHDNDVVHVGGTAYDTAYLSDNDIVETIDGDYEHEDDCVCIDDTWYHENDSRIIKCEDGEYRLRRDCTQTEDSRWYADDDDGLWVCDRTGCTYHTDNDEPINIDGMLVHESELTEEERHELACA